MEFVAEAGVPLPFEVTYDSDELFVAMQVYDVTSGTAVLVDTIGMENFSGYSYFGSFTPDENKSYAVNKGVYTDDTYTTRDFGYSQGSDSFRTGSGGGGGGGSTSPANLIAYVEPEGVLTLEINPSQALQMEIES
jgi:hypothetical protein